MSSSPLLLLDDARVCLPLQVYDAAICLAKYLESTVPKRHNYSHASLAGTRLLELGAGPGIVGLFASYYGAHSTLTDLESLMPLIEYNCEQNKAELSGPICARVLHWGLSTAQLQPPPDYLILANCVYYQSSLEPLRDSLLELSTPDTCILACYEIRCPEIGKLIDAWHELIAASFDVEYVDDDVVLEIAGSAYAQEFVRLAKLKRKPAS